MKNYEYRNILSETFTHNERIDWEVVAWVFFVSCAVTIGVGLFLL